MEEMFINSLHLQHAYRGPAARRILETDRIDQDMCLTHLKQALTAASNASRLHISAPIARRELLLLLLTWETENRLVRSATAMHFGLTLSRNEIGLLAAVLC
jgi:phage FluMu gp28-like protein